MSDTSAYEHLLRLLTTSGASALGLVTLDSRGLIRHTDASLGERGVSGLTIGLPLEAALHFLIGSEVWSELLQRRTAGVVENPLLDRVRGLAVVPTDDGFLAAVLARPLTEVAFHATPVAVIVVDEAVRLVTANERARELIGGVLAEGQDLATLIPSEVLAEVVRSAMAGATTPGLVSVEWARPEGRRVFELRCRRVAGALPLCVLKLEDVTEARQLAVEREHLLEAVHQSQKLDAIGQLASGVAHDMNNVLAVVQTCAGALRDEVKEALHKADAEQILLATQRARDLLHQLLAFARKEPARNERFDAMEMVREASSFVMRLLPPTVRLTLRLPTEPCEVLGDRSQLQQALINVCLNARDAMPHGGSIMLAGGFDDRRVTFAVSDTGEGMPKDVMQRAFEPFFSTKKRGSGTGLGLSMAYTSLRAHHGDIRLESRTGVGTRVSMWLPRESPSTDVDMVTPLTSHRGAAVVVDDDEATRNVLGRFLHKLGYVVHLAASGEEAVALMRSGLRPALVVCDLVMPGLDGSETMTKLRAIEPAISVILTSGFLDEGDAMVREAGARALLRKPFSMNDLAEAVAQLDA